MQQCASSIELLQPRIAEQPNAQGAFAKVPPSSRSLPVSASRRKHVGRTSSSSSSSASSARAAFEAPNKERTPAWHSQHEGAIGRWRRADEEQRRVGRPSSARQNHRPHDNIWSQRHAASPAPAEQSPYLVQRSRCDFHDRRGGQPCYNGASLMGTSVEPA